MVTKTEVNPLIDDCWSCKDCNKLFRDSDHLCPHCNSKNIIPTTTADLSDDIEDEEDYWTWICPRCNGRGMGFVSANPNVKSVEDNCDDCGSTVVVYKIFA